MPAKPQHSRRRLLKALAGAGGVYATGKILPEQWTKPVVDAVSLPAHAQTSAPFFDVIPLSFMDGRAPGGSLLDLLFPKAHAQAAPSEAHICLTPAGDEFMVDVVTFGFLISAGIRFDGSVAVGAETNLNLVDFAEGCDEPKKFALSLRLDSVADLANGALIVDSVPNDFGLPQAGCDLPDLGTCDVRGP